ncbi:Recombination inhibitory protein MutS2 [Listeria monocytogenes FSL J1-208]|uniref:endonuclease MutS2 n=1 Tax=Listeria monocytogenes TaxID=1639 RepID=UPI0002548928|nr:endonuclease MutS2 [Listeria monocytogenes]EAE5920662.1 endonuclease MutS2 [Listeria monocytogenes]EAG6686295.1 endonuclease MutS2 [Listeria monocytogenes]EHY63496.1 Recombination inhibitory protein MutS2 [Listeria monocytogenes FSL J1-208]OEO46258.1 endonuclease MutS2 [Listeria monocytogenes]QOF63457.1 endonuclease MutS2 [Listeria monocytogenes FSL J1-208]
MEKKVEAILEFDKIKKQLTEFASSSLGEQAILELEPATDFQVVQKTQLETEEGAKIIRLRGSAPITGLTDVFAHLKRLEIGGDLNGLEIYQIGSNLRVSRQMKNFMNDLLEIGVEIPLLGALSDELLVLKEVEEDIAISVDESGKVLDTASEALSTIRRTLRRTEDRVREKLESYLRDRNASKMLSDAVITIRNDRYVIPVKQEYKGHYGGIVHDQSASGQTLFIEPQSVVDLNNERKALQAKEKQEIERILAEISASLAAWINEIHHNTFILGRFDFVFAKARFGKAMKAVTPHLSDAGVVHLIAARHPLLDAAKVVANDIYLGEDFTTIVITGPNTGGKTITLKTLGLLTLMAQSGLQIPAQEDSTIAVFEHVFADIGDEQSIEQSLSTFSSHMTNIVSILENVNQKSLILYDELGAGTDPQEGAALAIAILDASHAKGASVVATTHYPELKAYGYNRVHATNASVEFNVETLSPTYKLLIGVPGRSNAFDISRRLGLSENIITEARSLVDTESADLNDMISSLEEKRNLAETEYEEARELARGADSLLKDLQKEITNYYQQKDKLIEQASEKAATIVEKAEAEAEEIIHELRTMQLNGAAGIKEHELIDAKTRLGKAKPKTINKTIPQAPKQKPHVFQEGDNVRVLSLGQKGTLLNKISDKEWNVQIGIIKMKIKTADLEYIQPEKPKKQRIITSVHSSDSPAKSELDLRGERYEDALQKVDKYLDEALLAGYPQVAIIHGKGTGALRTGVTEYLKNHRMVKSIRFGAAAEGGNGVTIVEFK